MRSESLAAGTDRVGVCGITVPKEVAFATVLYMRECRAPQAYHRSCGQRRPPMVSVKTYLLNTPKSLLNPEILMSSYVVGVLLFLV